MYETVERIHPSHFGLIAEVAAGVGAVFPVWDVRGVFPFTGSLLVEALTVPGSLSDWLANVWE